MRTFIDFVDDRKAVNEAAAFNTILANSNEILLGFFMLGATWNGFQGKVAAQKELKRTARLAGQTEFDRMSGHAHIMAQKAIEWSRRNGFTGSIKKAWWTNKDGDISKATGKKVNSKMNPSDTLVQFANGDYLGISAKSATRAPGKIGFKNPGGGTLDKRLGTNFKKMYDDAVLVFTAKHGLSSVGAKRKKEIRASDELMAAATQARIDVFGQIRDELFSHLSRMDQEKVRQWILSDLLNVGAEIWPAYIKVTGMGKKEPYTAKLLDPLKDNKNAAIQTKDIELMKLGNAGIGVMVAGKRIFKISVKSSSQAMASSLKYSANEW